VPNEVIVTSPKPLIGDKFTLAPAKILVTPPLAAYEALVAYDELVAYEALVAYDELVAYEALVAYDELVAYEALVAYDELVAYEALATVVETYEALNAWIANDAVPKSDPVIPAVTFSDPVMFDGPSEKKPFFILNSFAISFPYPRVC
jgi:hypothetical protein